MSYADEGFYTDRYLLGRKPVISAGFDFYSRQASQVIDSYTFGRLKQTAKIPEAVFSREKQKRDSGGKTSEKIGTYSVSFASSGESDSAYAGEQEAIVMKWLGGTGLCYQGV